MTVLRPRSLGEIFDYGITVLVRAFVRTLAIVAAVAISITGGVYAIHFDHDVARNVLRIVMLVALGFAGIVAFAALLFVFEREARRLPCSLLAAIAHGRRRFWPLLGTQVVLAIVGTAGFLSVGAIVFACVSFAGAIGSSVPGVGTILPLVIGFVLVVAGVVLYAPFATFLTVSLSVCVAEDAGVGRSIATGWLRCFTRRQYRRSTVVGLAWIAPLFAASLALGFLRAVLPYANLVGPALNVLVQVAASIIGYAWATVFSLDARIRYEGLDLFETDNASS